MTRRLLPALAVLVLAACVRGTGGAPAPAPVKDSELGLAKGSVFEVPDPPAVKENEAAPGERPPLARAYPAAPPQVPHAIGDFLPITREANACVDCHGASKVKEPGAPTPLPPSHYTDLRNAPGEVRETVAGARWACTACHLPITDARPLVESRFGR